MTPQPQQFKTKWITFANLVLLLTITFRGGYLISSVESGVKSNKIEIKEHIGDMTLHMPLEKKIKVFVPRTELDSRLKNIEIGQTEIKNKQEKIYKLLLQGRK